MSFPRNVEACARLVHKALACAFVLAVFLLFAPLALSYLVRGKWFEAGLAAAMAVYLGALLAPRD